MSEKFLSNIAVLPNEYSRIFHFVADADFNTNCPSPYRLERIANEVDRYLKYKRKCIEKYGQV